MPRIGRRPGLVTLVTMLGLVSCSTDTIPAPGLVPASVKLAPGSASTLAAAASMLSAGLAGSPIELSYVDSLIVHVTRVDVLPESLLAVCYPPRGDSAHGYRPMHPDSLPGGMPPRPAGCMGHRGHGPMGPGMGMGFGGGRFGFPPIAGDSLRPDSGWGRRDSQWFTLDVVGDGRLDLAHLPVAGLTLAAGAVPAGDYGAARLFVSDATIWLNTALTSDSGVTLEPDTAYPVLLPRMAERMGIASGASFTIPEGGAEVGLVFDAAATFAAAVLTDSGAVILRPVVRPRQPLP